MADPLQAKLSSLAEPQIRFDYFCSWIRQAPVAESAESLDRLTRDAEAFVCQAREGVLPFVGWVSGAVDPAHAVALGIHANAAGLFHLARVLGFASAHNALCFGGTPNRARVPSYGPRPLTLGERKSLARLPNRQKIEHLLRDPHPAVIEKLLKNPRLTETDVLQLVAQRPAKVELAALVLRTPRWLMSSTVRLGVVLNPHSPLWQSVPLLSTFRRQELLRTQRAADVYPALRVSAMERRNKVPPLPQRLQSATVH